MWIKKSEIKQEVIKERSREKITDHAWSHPSDKAPNIQEAESKRTKAE